MQYGIILSFWAHIGYFRQKKVHFTYMVYVLGLMCRIADALCLRKRSAARGPSHDAVGHCYTRSSCGRTARALEQTELSGDGEEESVVVYKDSTGKPS